MKRTHQVFLGFAVLTFGFGYEDVASQRQANELDSKTTVIDNYKVSVGNLSVEIEGVCKIGEADVTCWNPNGRAYRKLTEDVIRSLKNNKIEPERTFRNILGKKNRILVFKTNKTVPSSADRTSSSGFLNNSGNTNQHKWNQTHLFLDPPTFFDGGGEKTSRVFMFGSFERGSTESSLEYTISQNFIDPVRIPFQKGVFAVDGNSYEINSWGVPSGSELDSLGVKNSDKVFIRLKDVKISKPELVLILKPVYPADFKQDELDGGADKWIYLGETIPNVRNPRTGYLEYFLGIGPPKITHFDIRRMKQANYVFDKISLDQKEGS